MKRIPIALIPVVATAMLAGCSLRTPQSTTPDTTHYLTGNPGFRVRVPRLAGAYSLSDITVNEEGASDPELGTTVTFTGPGDDPEVYRVHAFEKPTNKPTRGAFIGLAKRARADMVFQAEGAHNALLAKFEAEKIAVNGRDALVAVYRQAVKPRFTLSGATHMRMRYHAMYFVDYGAKMAVFWVEMPADAWGAGGDLGERIAAHRVPKINRFLSSFEWVQEPPRAAALTGPVAPPSSDDAD